jgi:hypothetical protein
MVHLEGKTVIVIFTYAITQPFGPEPPPSSMGLVSEVICSLSKQRTHKGLEGRSAILPLLGGSKG